MIHSENHQILAQAGLLSGTACADTHARVASLSAEEVQHLLSTRTRLQQSHSRSESAFIIL